MGLMDDMKDKAMKMSDEKKAEIQRYADEHKMSFDDAKEHFMNKDKNE